ncbi:MULTISPECIES: aspartyl-phosphate phosphatase Spo0E family protein [unclassified Paenibacillus]|uniref:aspartyl-phosphate phosphatase Spo0E family protein n=1 Tax=unclassified Paenibacillus TaxID=185978 RepID=UPI00095572F7|nr:MULTISPECIES: aspartyl-phosphate phosphatase Spo0E family protein [unclassified Paenibacillus]ASS65067.2 aspartyl-phosphate phosphatase Spo0E family protein [Paenibacillus sp. RUD330]SIQ49818.1 Spo0E like sporulation regulatory protein [Paenibacillus sp. RU4X]SIQ71717.1 Spo0E like sporulation regulatory protein [Paenibacillus sp. RU4T]
MNERVPLNQQIERLRGQMVQSAATQNTLLHREVLRISQSLDRLIVQVQEERMTKSRKY